MRERKESKWEEGEELGKGDEGRRLSWKKKKKGEGRRRRGN